MSTSQESDGVAAGSLFKVEGLVALVTGGGTGIGLMLTKALAQNGAAKVYIAGRRLEVLQNAAERIGSNVVPLQCDVTSRASLADAVSAIEKDSGYLNLLVCNSGIGGPQPMQIQADTTLDEWVESNMEIDFDAYVNTFTVNSAAVWYTAMSFLKLLDKGNKKGNVEQTSQIVVTSSIAAFNKMAPGGMAYGQSKAAVTHLVKQLSVALPRWDIRANCIAPGLFPSEMSEPIVKKFSNDSGELGAVPAKMVPLRRMGHEKEMAGTMLYLASKTGGYCNGAIIVIDGGRLTKFPSAA